MGIRALLAFSVQPSAAFTIATKFAHNLIVVAGKIRLVIHGEGSAEWFVLSISRSADFFEIMAADRFLPKSTSAPKHKIFSDRNLPD